MKHSNQIQTEFTKIARTFSDRFVDNMVINYLKMYPDPSDNDFHNWTKRMFIDTHKAEESAYRLASLYVKSL
jgi:hypothetical protein